MKFSQRQGITPEKKIIQLESMDDELKNGLWNVLDAGILALIKDETNHRWNINLADYFGNSLWHNYFKLPIDTRPYFFTDVKRAIRKKFFESEWYEVYDLLEYCIEIVSGQYFERNIPDLQNRFNVIFEREFAGYRFIQDTLSPITTSSEVEAIELALDNTADMSTLKGCNLHLQEALNKISDRQNPDYRNSIKESISAVESIAKVISSNPNDTLGSALTNIKAKLAIHPALEKGFKQIYGYTSDDAGIRHALMNESTCGFEDAKFMLVSCSAFVNYLIVKAEKAQIKL